MKTKSIYVGIRIPRTLNQELEKIILGNDTSKSEIIRQGIIISIRKFKNNKKVFNKTINSSTKYNPLNQNGQ